ncbi:AI-2E family transporter [Rufibacter sp. XAAS-G3-1]|uniref:AI-2E family transporter n=1 Tax=Rufibacter sp. XAAS-G3-1 TaxID=2729134 RepID=UPI0015E7B6D2|nr:AI-2E family transporter [Rufibacter sp. XAAS-G3-1]
MNKLPLTVRRSIELVGLVVLALVIVQGQGIIMPLLMALVISIVLLPVYTFLRRNKFPEVLAIFLSILLMIIIISVVVFFIASQIAPLTDNFPQIKSNITNHLHALSAWFTRLTSISITEQTAFIDEQIESLVDSAWGFIGGAAGSVGSVFVFFGLLLIYTFFILFYKDILSRFLYSWFKPAAHPQVQDTIQQIKSVLNNYIVGLLIQITYLTVLLGGALMLLGIEHAMLIGVVFAIFNLIPYVGALFANLVGVLLTLSSSPELGPIFTVLIAITVVQMLDNYILMPGIVGSKIQINALASLVGVFIGGALTGVAGMFLSLPCIAMLKIIFDHTDQFKQWAILFSDEKPNRKLPNKLLHPKSPN